jgi:hypothetical protein
MEIIKRYGNSIVVGPFDKISCSCCGECQIRSAEDYEVPTVSDLLKTFGKKCGRDPLVSPPEGFMGMWPTLPCKTPISSSGLLGNDAYNSPYTGRYRRADACLAFYYRIVNEEISNDGRVFDEGTIVSGARDLKSGIELWLPYREDKPDLFEYESCGMYIYVFHFMHWHSRESCSPLGCREGGAQAENPSIRVYNVDMFYGYQYGPFYPDGSNEGIDEWPPKW